MGERLRRVESRNVTFLSERFPVFWEDAVGSNVRDVDGNVYVDFTGAFGVALAGHAHPRVRTAVEAQSARLIHGMGDVHPPRLKLELLERLADLAPWEDARGVLASSGSEAIEIALKTAELATGRSGVLAFEGSYHGLTLGSLAVTGRSDFREPFRGRLHDRVAFAPFPTLGAGSAWASLAEVERALTGHGPFDDPIGSVVVEPIQGRAGVLVPPPGFLSRLAELARAAGAVLIFDEIFTGFGRTGTLFAFEHEGVVPDLLCVGKALGGGFPLSACLGSREVMDAWPESSGEALHTSTFLGHPASCAAAIAFLEVLKEENLLVRAATLGGRLLGALRSGLARVSEVRGRGLLIGIDTDRPGAGASIASAALARGLLVLPAGPDGEVVEIAPPAVLSEAQADFGVECLVDVVRTVLGA
jgi:4-aminobutyrate aminotransferase/(S)-3-amino-2-methylpropionate transaminase